MGIQFDAQLLHIVPNGTLRRAFNEGDREIKRKNIMVMAVLFSYHVVLQTLVGFRR